MKKLTKRQQEIYDYLLSELLTNHNVPRTTKVANHFRIKPNAAYEHLNAIMRRGHIENVSEISTHEYRLAGVNIVIEGKVQ